MFEIIRNGIFNTVEPPVFGRQDIGVTPGGAMDNFSYETGNALLNNEKDAPALEIILAPYLKFKEDCYFIITGAKYSDVKIDMNDEKTSIEHGRVSFAKAGSTIEFNQKEYGFRTYFCYISAKKSKGNVQTGRLRGDFKKIASWQDTEGKIRVVEGPEFKYLDDKILFLNEYWSITNDISSMGMRIENKWVDLNISMNKSMVSEAVSDGTIQLTPNGPIILLKHRQTVGGYPRIFNVISVDVDMLAQFSPGQIIHFKKVTINEAHKALKKRYNDILNIQKK
jgi:allophanate hydrolase subunit 2